MALIAKISSIFYVFVLAINIFVSGVYFQDTLNSKILAASILSSLSFYALKNNHKNFAWSFAAVCTGIVLYQYLKKIGEEFYVLDYFFLLSFTVVMINFCLVQKVDNTTDRTFLSMTVVFVITYAFLKGIASLLILN